MITVKRQQDQSSQKVVSTFLKRVKKSNSMARARKSRYHTKPLSDLIQKSKAIKTADFYLKDEILKKIGKK